jgi:ribosomal protein S18 acetylase RimI-like enzyme
MTQYPGARRRCFGHGAGLLDRASKVVHARAAAYYDARMSSRPTGFRDATIDDAPTIAALVNGANAGERGALGWTHESHLFEGDRTDADEIAGLMRIPRARFILALDGDRVAGCVYVKPLEGRGYFGFLAVRPALQSYGLGKRLVAQAERVARDEWGCRAMRITVITSHRLELVAFYQRRGYVRTGIYKTFQRKQSVEAAVARGVRLEWMEKPLGISAAGRKAAKAIG